MKFSNKETDEIYGKRKIDVESFFGFLKTNLGFNRRSVRANLNVYNEIGFALIAVNIKKYTAIITGNGTFSLESRKNACVYLFMINTSIFIYLKVVCVLSSILLIILSYVKV